MLIHARPLFSAGDFDL